MLAHQLDRPADLILRPDGDEVTAGDLTDRRGTGIAALGERPDHDVPVGEHPADAAVLGDEYVADVVVAHLRGRVGDGGVVGETDGLGSHRLAYQLCHRDPLRRY